MAILQDNNVLIFYKDETQSVKTYDGNIQLGKENSQNTFSLPVSVSLPVPQTVTYL